MKKTLIITIGIAILAVAAVAMIKGHQAVKDAYFEPDTDKLRQVPANLLVIRPTRFPHAYGKIRHYHGNESLARTVGQNVSFQSMMAEAYDCDFAQVILPPGAPQGNFDFLVTKPAQVREQLRTAIQKQLGYTAHCEKRDMDALILEISDPSLPGLTISGSNEDSDINYKGGKLYFTHKPFDHIVDGLSQGLDEPILDQTGLTNYYDFSMAWNADIEKAMQHGSVDLAKTEKVIANWGLGLEATNVSMDVYVVEKAH
jgi:uncharacterized protein (TIGR03435 family)